MGKVKGESVLKEGQGKKAKKEKKRDLCKGGGVLSTFRFWQVARCCIEESPDNAGEQQLRWSDVSEHGHDRATLQRRKG